MLQINLLPPELRKKRGGSDFNPIALAVAASFLVALLPAGVWGWLKYVRLPAAQTLLAEKQAELATRTAEADAVEQLRKQIADFEKHRDLVVGLLAQKVYWARTIDEFATTVTGPWNGFEVSCSELSIQAANRTENSARKTASSTITFVVKGRYKLIGEERAKAGDYVRSFFNGVESSTFWTTHGMVGKPEATYRGDTPGWNEKLQRVTIEFNLDWPRSKSIVVAKGGK